VLGVEGGEGGVQAGVDDWVRCWWVVWVVGGVFGVAVAVVHESFGCFAHCQA